MNLPELALVIIGSVSALLLLMMLIRNFRSTEEINSDASTIFTLGSPDNLFLILLGGFTLVLVFLDTVVADTGTNAPILHTIALSFQLIVTLLSGRLGWAIIESIVDNMGDEHSESWRLWLKQLLRTVLVVIVTLVLIALITGQHILVVLSGFSALVIAIMFVFRDAIMGLVSAISLTSKGLVQNGDWIEVPEFHADGEVLDVGIQFTRISNWDSTTTSVPTHQLLNAEVRNWRGMTDAGMRRVKRSLLIDQRSVRALQPAEIKALSKLTPANDNKDSDNNLVLFAAWFKKRLLASHAVHADGTILVRLCEATEAGLPVEIYCFTNTTEWEEYESILTGIVADAITQLPDFHLDVAQRELAAPAEAITKAGTKA